jgi:hypothetical protein
VAGLPKSNQDANKSGRGIPGTYHAPPTEMGKESRHECKNYLSGSEQISMSRGHFPFLLAPSCLIPDYISRHWYHFDSRSGK